MFQDPKGYIVQMCEVHLQYGNSTTRWRFYTFFELIPLYTNLFYLFRTLDKYLCIVFNHILKRALL